MRVLVDTNILISAILFPNSKMEKVLLYVTENYEMILCERNITELREVLKRKKPERLPDAEIFLKELKYELIPAIYHVEQKIRDTKDQPILNAAIAFCVDVILTGDKGFFYLELERPKCLSATDFLYNECLRFTGMELARIANAKRS